MNNWILPEQEKGYLTDKQMAQVKILFNTLQPGDQERNIPNAEKANAIEFLHLLLARGKSVYKEIPQWQNLYTNVLKELDKYCLEKFNKNLENISSDQCELVIQGLETNTLNPFDKNIDQAIFFDVIRRHCIQGCFCDPRWGGNKDKIMWKWYGYLEETKQVNF